MDLLAGMHGCQTPFGCGPRIRHANRLPRTSFAPHTVGSPDDGAGLDIERTIAASTGGSEGRWDRPAWALVDSTEGDERRKGCAGSGTAMELSGAECGPA